MSNEIAGFGILNLFFLVIFSELTINYVIGFDRFVRILGNQRKCQESTTFFNVQQSRVMCTLEFFSFSGY
jgi:hypothetical protein